LFKKIMMHLEEKIKNSENYDEKSKENKISEIN
jgi:hypothetical protein